MKVNILQTAVDWQSTVSAGCTNSSKGTVTHRYFCSATFVLQLQKLRVVFTRKPKVARCTLLFVLRNPSAAKVATGGCESVHTQGATFAAAVMLQVSISVLTSQYTFCGYVRIIKKLMRKLLYLLFAFLSYLVFRNWHYFYYKAFKNLYILKW